MQQGLILQQIDSIRKLQPRCRGRKLFVELQLYFKDHHLTMGKDKLFSFLKSNKLLVRKLKRNVYTTNSKHHFRRYSNLIKDFEPMKACELWVADVTTISLKTSACIFILNY